VALEPGEIGQGAVGIGVVLASFKLIAGNCSAYCQSEGRVACLFAGLRAGVFLESGFCPFRFAF
jgi:hypothetical protein